MQELEQAYISSPVPNLAATLTTQAEEDTHEENLSFLRRQPSPSRDPSLTRSERAYLGRASYTPEDHTRRLDRENRRRLIRSADMIRRLPVVLQGEDDGQRRPNYTNRNPNRQSLYDWAPGSDDEDAESMLNSLRDLGHLNESRENLPRYAQSRWSNWRAGTGAGRSERPNFRNTPQPRDEPSGSITLRSWTDEHPDRRPQDPNLSLHQSLERHRRRAYARSQLQMYVADPDRVNAARENESAPREATSTRLHRSERPSNLYSLTSHRATRADLCAAYRQMIVESPSLSCFRDSISYLSRLRHCRNEQEVGELAKTLGIISELENSDCPSLSPPSGPPASSSWLAPGAVWCGRQLSSHDSGTGTAASILHQRDRLERLARSHGSLDSGVRRLLVPDRRNPLAQSRLNLSNALDALSVDSVNAASNSSSYVPSHPDHWPVRVTLHTVDLENSTLTGTMEAYNIPDKSSPHYESSMKSFFEGEIIDFCRHDLETENYDSGIESDTLYWRELGPFKQLKDEELSTRILDKKWLHKCGLNCEERQQSKSGRRGAGTGGKEDGNDDGWVLMRWKGKKILEDFR